MYKAKITLHRAVQRGKRELSLLNPELRDLFLPFSAVLEPFQGAALVIHGGECPPCSIPCCTLCSWCKAAEWKRKLKQQAREKRTRADTECGFPIHFHIAKGQQR